MMDTDVTHWLMKPQAALGNWRWWERDVVRPTTCRATSRLSLNFLLHLVWAEYHQLINLWNHSDLIRLLSKGAVFNKHKCFCSPIRRFDALVCWLQFRNKNHVHHFTPTTFFFLLMFWLPVNAPLTEAYVLNVYRRRRSIRGAFLPHLSLQQLVTKSPHNRFICNIVVPLQKIVTMTTTIKVIKKETLLQVSIMNTLHVCCKGCCQTFF